MVVDGEDHGGDPGNVAARNQVRDDAAMRPGVPLAAHQHAARGGKGCDHRPGEVRRADAHPAGQGRHREGRATANRSKEPADQRRRRDHLVPRREGDHRARRAARPAGRRRRPARSASGRSRSRPGIRSISALNCSDMRFPGKTDVLLNLGNRYGERAAPGTKLISIRLDPDEPRPHDAGRPRHGRRPAARGRRSHRRGEEPRDDGATQGDRRGAHRSRRAPNQARCSSSAGRSHARMATSRR